MYNKFIITNSGELIFGNVYLHRELLPKGEDSCLGGGLWKIDNQNGRMILYGKSFDFGYPELDAIRKVDRSDFPGNMNLPMFYLRKWVEEDVLEPVEVNDK